MHLHLLENGTWRPKIIENWLSLPNFLLFLASRLHFPVDVNAPIVISILVEALRDHG